MQCYYNIKFHKPTQRNTKVRLQSKPISYNIYFSSRSVDHCNIPRYNTHINIYLEHNLLFISLFNNIFQLHWLFITERWNYSE
jgi:hypothetical protein